MLKVTRKINVWLTVVGGIFLTADQQLRVK
jgi:hypothetical protein